jgi:hypothetical protein
MFVFACSRQKFSFFAKKLTKIYEIVVLLIELRLIFFENFGENEIFCETKFRVNLNIFAYFSLFTKIKHQFSFQP